MFFHIAVSNGHWGRGKLALDAVLRLIKESNCNIGNNISVSMIEYPADAPEDSVKPHIDGTGALMVPNIEGVEIHRVDLTLTKKEAEIFDAMAALVDRIDGELDEKRYG